MPHRVQVRPLAARRVAMLLPGLFALACERSGEVIVVLDSTMRGEGVEVVVARTDNRDGAPNAARPAPRTDNDPLADTVAALDTRFRELRDSLNREVAALDSADRRTRSYAVRYADVRRATLAAERIRVQRDSARTRLGSTRPTAGTGAQPAPDAVDGGDAPGASEAVRRHAVRDSVVALSLEPGRWAVGAAADGRAPSRVIMVDVTRGSRDTVRIGPAGAPPDQSP